MVQGGNLRSELGPASGQLKVFSILFVGGGSRRLGNVFLGLWVLILGT